MISLQRCYDAVLRPALVAVLVLGLGAAVLIPRAAVAQPGNIILSISKGDTPDPVAPGATLTYTILYGNTGDTTATGVVITETYDSDVTFSSATPAPDSGDNIWNIGNLPAWYGGSISVSVTVGASANGTTLTNLVSINCTEGVSDSAEIETTVLVSAPPVGGTAYPISKLIILLPWVALAGATAGIAILARRRRAQS